MVQKWSKLHITAVLSPSPGTDGFAGISLLMSNVNWFRKHKETEMDILFFFTDIHKVQKQC